MSVAAGFNAARSIVCVEIAKLGLLAEIVHSFNAARSIVCVETRTEVALVMVSRVSMPHAALCVSRPLQTAKSRRRR